MGQRRTPARRMRAKPQKLVRSERDLACDGNVCVWKNGYVKLNSCWITQGGEEWSPLILPFRFSKGCGMHLDITLDFTSTFTSYERDGAYLVEICYALFQIHLCEINPLPSCGEAQIELVKRMLLIFDREGYFSCPKHRFVIEISQDTSQVDLYMQAPPTTSLGKHQVWKHLVTAVGPYENASYVAPVEENYVENGKEFNPSQTLSPWQFTKDLFTVKKSHGLLDDNDMSKMD